MASNTTLDAVSVALWAATAQVHGLDPDEDISKMITQRMAELDIPESEFASVRAVFDALLGFANAVRTAERRQDAIWPVAKRLG